MSDHEPRNGTVVVGVSPTSGSPAALRWGADEAKRRGTDLVALSAWRPPRPPMAPGGRPPGVTYDAEEAVGEARERLAEQVRATLGEGVQVFTEIVHGSTFRVLLQASETAEMLVLDAPSRLELPEGPTLARRLIYSAECPVVIMPPKTLG
ncbi:universal stress protein [Amnibacterium sp.]|uniref:universal stress protein n=1 Tax=Amnibacterium sp. TaxID=1872496 RepID=UPI002627BD91|nr:universal stress protein [Amnibacterium sp.]MCU1473104.1 universal stress protein [Amnibacterium sp.]